VLVKYTYYGDANFDGKVNFDDYARIDAGFNSGATGWLNGDFNEDTRVNFDDYALIDNAFNYQGGSLGQAAAYMQGGNSSASFGSAPGLQKVHDHWLEFGSSYRQALMALLFG
jgi:hypothetical protein